MTNSGVWKYHNLYQRRRRKKSPHPFRKLMRRKRRRRRARRSWSKSKYLAFAQTTICTNKLFAKIFTNQNYLYKKLFENKTMIIGYCLMFCVDIKYCSNIELQYLRLSYWMFTEVDLFHRTDDGWQEGPKVRHSDNYHNDEDDDADDDDDDDDDACFQVKPAKSNTGTVDQLTTGKKQ